jgi:hypothetical protein
MLRTQLSILKRLTRYAPADTVALGREVAQACVLADRYPVYAS